MDSFKIFENDWLNRLLLVIIIIVISWLIYKIITGVIVKGIEGKNLKVFNNKKGKTYVKLIKSIIRYIFLSLTLLLILQVLGINISSVVAGVGILGVVFGLAIQDFLKDIIRGSTILSDGYFSVGDVVKYKDIEGVVLSLGLKTTKIKDLRTSNIISIANRNIEQIEIVSEYIYVRIPMPYEVSLKKAENAIVDIVSLVKENPEVLECNYKSVAELADSSIQYLLEVKCNPLKKLQTNRDTIRCILVGLDKHQIAVPFNQIDVHQK